METLYVTIHRYLVRCACDGRNWQMSICMDN